MFGLPVSWTLIGVAVLVGIAFFSGMSTANKFNHVREMKAQIHQLEVEKRVTEAAAKTADDLAQAYHERMVTRDEQHAKDEAEDDAKAAELQHKIDAFNESPAVKSGQQAPMPSYQLDDAFINSLRRPSGRSHVPIPKAKSRATR